MENMVLAMPILSDAASLSASTSAGTLPVSNLKTMSPKEVWRALDASAAYVVIDLLAAKEINLLSLIAHSGSSRSYARVRAATSEANLTAAPAYDSGNVALRSHQSGYDATWALGVTDEEYGALDKNNFILWFGTNTKTYRYWRVDLVDPNAAYIDVGRLYVAKAWQPSTNMDYGLSEGFVDPSRKLRTVSGVMTPVERQKYRVFDFKISFSTESAMYDNGFQIDYLRGRTKDVLFINDPSATGQLQRRSLYGTMESLPPITNTMFQIFEKTFRIEELSA